ncbi:membrane fusion protein (multidrug efflux system) [Mucilaginibacter sp. SG538B]|uniref:HlyD family secretion protein n=1 Tax=Mucilaginibacter sp. SG538B TaxID=2587021 RepID=UPI00159DF23F|nr:HlyD family secretion protein [Mucilaginibacter sp. SG538B]NVM66742.1 membrane fusion protein (multidrug efflux system) [Mucilaginibacter sp. SG538B]
MGDTTRENAPPKKNWVVIMVNSLLILAAGAAIVWGVSTYFDLGNDLYTNDAQVEEYINPINTRVAGYIDKVYFREHQLVRKGDTLVTIDNREYKIQAESAEAAYLSALADSDVAVSAVKTVSSNIAVSSAYVSASLSRLTNAAKDLHRYENLLVEGAATQQQYDLKKSDYEALRAQTTALFRQKNTAALSANESSTRIKTAEAEIKHALAALKMAKLNLSYTIITAPYSGYTGRRIIQEGQLLQAGQNLLSFVRNDDKWITANYLETQLPGLHIGTKVKLKIDALGGRQILGRVTAISEATGSRYSGIPLDNSTGNFVKVRQRVPVRIEIIRYRGDNEILPLLRAGMNVEVRLAN